MPFDLGQPMRLTPAQRDAARGRLAKMRLEALARMLAGLTREAMAANEIVTPLNREGVYRRPLRTAFCLQGWPWQAADAAAARVVEVTFEILQTKRPSWPEGQRDWTISRGDLIERTRCANCRKPLPEERPKFCCHHCARAYNARLNRLREAQEDRAAMLAIEGDL